MQSNLAAQLRLYHLLAIVLNLLLVGLGMMMLMVQRSPTTQSTLLKMTANLPPG
ncbi:MAG: hypothetical protein AAF378_23980 [Cyanobacteria bacterium P01_A01_bin.84]